MWGRCKVCEEKDKRIADLKAFIETFTPHNTSSSIPVVTIEANKLLSADQEMTDLGDNEAFDADTLEQVATVESERDRLLAGTY